MTADEQHTHRSHENEQPEICEECLDHHAQDLCWAVARAPLKPHQFDELLDHDLIILVTVSQYITDVCLNQLERRNLIEIDPEHGPMIPYNSDHRVETILTRMLDEAAQ